MNKAFTKEKKIVLSEHYHIEPISNSNGVALVRNYEIESKDDFGDLVSKPAVERWFFTRVAQALRKYADLELVFDDTIEDLIEKTERVYFLIEKIDKEFKQF